MNINDVSPQLLETISRVLEESNHNYRSISDIASEISKDWKQPNYAAKPYLQAMFSLDKMQDDYGQDSAVSVVSYFLSNASQWKGETAKRIKAELKAMCSGKPVIKEEVEIFTEEERIEELEAQELKALVTEAGGALAVLKGVKELPSSNQWDNRHEIQSKSSGRKYIVAQNRNNGNWGCSCPGWCNRRKCKHLTALGLDNN